MSNDPFSGTWVDPRYKAVRKGLGTGTGDMWVVTEAGRRWESTFLYRGGGATGSEACRELVGDRLVPISRNSP